MANKTLITGGAGFIGSNYAFRLLQRGEEVILYDNLSRRGAADNLKWLEENFGKKSFQFVNDDVRNLPGLEKVIRSANVVIHLAAQVAVTSSVANPREDFEINALGTFNVLEAARKAGHQPVIIFASTNKVYGGLEDLRVEEEPTRYQLVDYPNGIAETRGLDFHSPYGCSKGCGDQYVRDYSRIFQIPTVVFRQSCIYGKRQFGIEDQGWVAWFVIAARLGRAISIFGDGKQVRDLLFVDDLIDAYDLAIEKISQVSGQVFNIGGGIENAISIWREFQPLLEKIQHQKIAWNQFGWRPGDQKIYISDTTKIHAVTGWKPRIDVARGIEILSDWVNQNAGLFKDFF
jgi:CDP-paratose 2-epimerase